MDEAVDDVRLYPIDDLANAIIQGTTRLPLMVESLIRMQQAGNLHDDDER